MECLKFDGFDYVETDIYGSTYAKFVIQKNSYDAYVMPIYGIVFCDNKVMAFSMKFDRMQKHTDIGVNILEMKVMNNIYAMNAQQQFKIVGKKKSKTSEKLASGYRINRAADDAAGLAISEKMRWQIRGLNKGTQNCQEGISMCQIADGAMAEIQNMIHRINELCVQAANGTNTDSDRESIDQEIQQIKKEIDRVGNETTFNEIKVLQGNKYKETRCEIITTITTVKELVGIRLGDEISYETDPDIERYLQLTGKKYHIGDYSYVSKYGARDDKNILIDLSNIENADAWKKLHGVVLNMTCSLGCEAESTWIFDNTKSGISVTGGNPSAEYSNITCVIGTKDYTNSEDFIDDLFATCSHWNGSFYKVIHAHDIGIYRAENLVPNASSSQLLFTGSQAIKDPLSNQGMLRAGRYNLVYEYSEREEKITENVTITEIKNRPIYIQYGCEEGHNLEIGLPHIDCEELEMISVAGNPAEKAVESIKTLKDVLQKVSAERSRMGAYTNGMEHLIAAENNTIENTAAAESVIRDYDMAKGMVEYSKHNILEQVGTAMIAQANHINENILNLLQ